MPGTQTSCVRRLTDVRVSDPRRALRSAAISQKLVLRESTYQVGHGPSDAVCVFCTDPVPGVELTHLGIDEFHERG